MIIMILIMMITNEKNNNNHNSIDNSNYDDNDNRNIKMIIIENNKYAIIIMLLCCYRLRVNYKLYKVYRYSSQDRGPAPPDNIFRNFIISSVVLTQSNFGVTSAHTSAQHSNILHKPSNLNFLQLWRQLWLNGPHSKLYWRLSLPEGIPNIYNICTIHNIIIQSLTGWLAWTIREMKKII